LGAAADELGAGATNTRVDPADREQVDGFFRGLGGLDHLVLASAEQPAPARRSPARRVWPRATARPRR